MRAQRDAQRSRVYAAETVLGDTGMRYTTEVEAYQYLRVLMHRAWFRERWPNFNPNTVAVTANGVRRASARVVGGTKYIRVPRKRMFQCVLLHELAHHLTRNADQCHGREFAHTLLVLFEYGISPKDAANLRYVFKGHKVKHTMPRKLTPERRAQLRLQGQALAQQRQHTTTVWQRVGLQA